VRCECDVAIVGGGPVGLALAAALAGSGLALALIEPQPRRVPPADDSWDSRVYALSPGNAAFLQRCGAWERLPRERLARIEAMEIRGDDGRARLEFSAYEAGLRELAFIVENRELQHALWSCLNEREIAVFCPASWSELEFGADCARLRLADGSEIAARLVVAADGADSPVRTAARIAVAERAYGQLGVVANFECERPHRGLAYQWFRRDGVLALLPLPGQRVSMVWSVAQARGHALLALPLRALACEVAEASGAVVGALRPLAPAAAFPLRWQRVSALVRPRLALVGDAAHNVHPLAGQGMNLGLRDARALANVLRARGPMRDCGDYALLRRYARARAEDVLAIEFTTDGLQKLFASEAVSLSVVRNLGLGLVNRLPQLKNFLVHQAIA
jgi:ubiquinone biosynthesis UbiH/UbiF/VisC/COQ6 family hydroxylase